MKRLVALLALVAATLALSAEVPESKGFREPFTLKLGIDQGRYYEQKITQRIPYVHEGTVMLFNGERFGVKLVKAGDGTTAIRYEPDEKAADLLLKFYQEKINGGLSMILTLENRTRDTLHLDALMVVPDQKTPARTSILPLGPGVTNYET